MPEEKGAPETASLTNEKESSRLTNKGTKNIRQELISQA